MMWLRMLLVTVLVWLNGGAPSAYAQPAFPESIGTGEVVEVDLSAGTIIIEGYRYRFAPGLPVQIGGGSSDVSLLAPGMKIQFRFLRVPDDLREVIEIREIPPGVKIYRL
jgi:hypothetical protein